LTATDGKEALEKLHRFHPQLVILDILMPVISGLEFIERLKASEQTKDIRVIVFTAKSDFSMPPEHRTIPVVSKNAGIPALVAQIDKLIRS